MKTTIQIARRGFTLVELLVVIVIIAALAGLTAPMVIRQRKKADQTEAVNNARQIGLAMFEFDQNFGSFPGGNTLSPFNADGDFEGHGYTLNETTSNGLFLQLFAANLANSESMFYAKAPGTKKPDNSINKTTTLDKKEVGFGYVLDGTNGLSTSANPAIPYVMTPLVEGEVDVFDIDAFDSKAVVLKIDGSVQSLNVNKDGEASMGGKPVFEKGVDTVWGSRTPTPVGPDY
jgi:prepilin-type N-terminal cleavage/methylation domain-containing protein